MDGMRFESPLEIADHLNKYFATVGSSSQMSPEETSQAASNCPPLDGFSPTPLIPPLVIPPCKPDDVMRLISELDGETLDIHGVHTAYLKDGSKLLAPLLFHLINLSLESSTFPDLLKIARVVPIYKKGARTDASNYRPISILPLISKLFEKYVDEHLRLHLDANNLWNQNQFGFRKGMSTLYALLRLVERISTSFSAKQMGVGFFIDVKKAFDSVNHSRLLSKLPQFGITGPLLSWFASYLRNRRQYVDSPLGPSQQELVLAGVPQGSVLGPLLFNLYVNDLPQVLKTMWPSLFADDTSLFAFSRSLPDLVQRCVDDLKEVELWFKANYLQPNAAKSSSLFFISRALQAHHHFTFPEIVFDGALLDTTPTAKFLGFHLTSSLSWSDHISSLLKKLGRFSGLFFLLKQNLPTAALLSLYNSLVLPHFADGIEIWGSSDPSTSNLRPFSSSKKSL
eukprot:Pompholyxophrys_punicea_v1_NODE_18_length_5920_cov_44.741176.p2 type:complete len:454 gc:universal NODE_18_length_5920_cov_44.741176:4094-5455(+)